MFTFLLTLFSFAASLDSLTSKPKLCINCQHFIKDDFHDNSFAKCAMFPQIEINKHFLVDEEDKKEYITHRYCSTARALSHMCGETAKLFKEKTKTKPRRWGQTIYDIFNATYPPYPSSSLDDL